MRHTHISRLMAAAAATGVVVALLIAASSAVAQTGGSPALGTEPAPPATAPPGNAVLLASGKAIPPADAPPRIVRAIQAGNRIRKKPYCWGGGHASFDAKCYDCSGAVSYVLHAAKMLKRPLASGALGRWGTNGRGRWITVYGRRSHAYAVIAGLRWDTSAMGSGGKGPRWRATKRSPRGYKVRHLPGF